MRSRVVILSASMVGIVCMLLGSNVWAQGFAAVPGQKGGQDMFGPYDIDPNWPQDLAELPGHEGWTYGAGQSVFAESLWFRSC